MVPDVIDSHIIELLIGRNAVLQDLDFFILLLVVCFLHFVQRILGGFNRLVSLGIIEIVLEFRKILQQRKGKDLPKVQGLILGSTGAKNKVTALVDGDDVHCLMIGASGVGKTAFFLYPNLEYACASGMSYLALDTKGDLARNYGTIAHDCYCYQVAVIDLRNPTRSDGNNFLALVNQYVDISEKDPTNIAAKAKAEKYAKILAKTIISPDGDSSSRGQNAFFVRP